MEETQIKDNNKKEGYNTRIGPLLKKVFERQKEIIKEATWECMNPSDYEVGEIIAKKITEKNLI